MDRYNHCNSLRCNIFTNLMSKVKYTLVFIVYINLYMQALFAD